MAFFQDLKAAAKDLAENGMNLDKLQEEVGTEKREPLPVPPPLRSTPTKAAAPAALLEAPPSSPRRSYTRTSTLVGRPCPRRERALRRLVLVRDFSSEPRHT